MNGQTSKKNSLDDPLLPDNTTANTDCTNDKTHYSLNLGKERSVDFLYTEDFEVLKNFNMKSIEDWQFGETIGKGSYSAIKIIINSKTNEEQAQKIYNKTLLTKGYFGENQPLDKVFKEIRYWREFSNEHIAKLHEHFNDLNDEKMSVRCELGDLGCPGYWSSDYTKYTIKERVYDQFQEKIKKEKRTFLKRVASVENSKNNSIQNSPNAKRKHSSGGENSGSKKENKSDESVHRRLQSATELILSPDNIENRFKKNSPQKLVIENKHVTNIDAGSPLINIDDEAFQKSCDISKSQLVNSKSSPENKDIKLFEFPIKRQTSVELDDPYQKDLDDDPQQKKIDDVQFNLVENERNYEKNPISIKLQQSESEEFGLQYLNSSIDVAIQNNQQMSQIDETNKIEKKNYTYVDLVGSQRAALNKANFSPIRDTISHKIFVDMVKQFSPNCDQFAKLNKSDIIDGNSSHKKTNISPSKHALVYAENMCYEHAIQDFLTTIEKDFDKKNPNVMKSQSNLPIQDLCKIDVFNKKLDCQGFDVDYDMMEIRNQKQYVIGRIFFDVCIGIQYQHHIGITHRDIKNDNTVITSKERGGPKAMVIDFNSISYWEEIGVNIRDTTGLTKAYAAPEVIDENLVQNTISTMEELDDYLIKNPSEYEDKSEEESEIEFKLRKLAEYGHFQRMKCDIYSLGIVQYVMYFGRFPYKSLNNKLIENEIQDLDIEKATENTPEPIRSQIVGMLEKDPEKRFNWDDNIWSCKLFERLHKKIIIRDE